MSQTQKIIKYVAIAFGIFLAINIICGIVFAGLGILGLSFMGDKIFSSSVSYVEKTYDIFEDIHNLDIELEISEFEIREGESFKVEVSNVSNRFELSSNNGTLKIRDKLENRVFNMRMKNAKIIIYVPQETEFEKVNIKTGVGSTKIDKLITDNLKLEIGVGKFYAQQLIAKEVGKIEGGVGKVEIESGEFNNANLSTGVGEFAITGTFKGNSIIECGIGKATLTLQDSIENYTINTETGIGAVHINGNKATNEMTYGAGVNLIRIHGGVGAVEVKTK